MTQETISGSFDKWKEREAIAEAMIPLIGKLYRDYNVVTSVYSRAIINRSVIDIIKAHRFVRQMESRGLSVEDSYPILKALSEMNLGPARIDLGKLAIKYKTQAEGRSVEEFLRTEVADIIDQKGNGVNVGGQDVILYGFGRIGRLMARILIERAGGGDGINLKAIVVRKGKAADDLAKRASLLRRDSIHGSFQGTLTIDHEGGYIIANGNPIKIIYANSPDSIDYTEYGINDAIVVDNTGVWRDEDGLGQHLKSKGVAKVILTAPGKGDIKNIVYGVNDNLISEDDAILSAASCTTNAITPVLKALNDEYGIKSGHVETVHAYTNDQNLIDNYHKGDRRGRGAALNMVITETGAAKAVAKALPELAGKLTGNAIRVPTPNVSMAILNLNLNKSTDAEALNDFLRHTSLHSDLQKQIDYVKSPEVVSSDFVGSRYAGIVDAEATIVDGDRCVLYVWYDNEFGYSCQVNRILQHLAGVNYPVFPKS
ncbi:glyceraldehyde-3-phosphate dehydrogenase [Aestuariirhabdus sp. Z084]|uniref:glyceraldehyde-3-phosphate dehydrogenase n=1 Tax=Aestuariirhabdus haliotis TaxID=2918751 RepID=UPI00201B3674|nr:glyceraldehyde-3-phosphate dehydrogenase [Aestuariirhabdus haliotis]MCL6414763.1 glyceraldehyde-3-phosphate dehydrogenase [Aestuariirhabdus haliotis]MCL6418695.1 glyceraldehyde-3-phosphate dehydrogenase [Aestuariirhabdus haliotis]